ncbi:MAG: M48 family metallopeptidase [Synergistaceae bacterium]|nr:M48 family metallopeptidase [Synergistaceae bacterium]
MKKFIALLLIISLILPFDSDSAEAARKRSRRKKSSAKTQTQTQEQTQSQSQQEESQTQTQNQNQNQEQSQPPKIKDGIRKKTSSDPELNKEYQIGYRAASQIEEKWPLTSDPAITSRLEMILNRLEPYMQRRIQWDVKLVKTEAMNAFCLPGGYIFFTTGIIDALTTDSEIAAVMAHEMIHADRKHSLRMAAESQKVNLAALAVMILGGGAIAPIVLAQVAQVAITSGYTMELEKEADRLGLDALIRSGYSPTGMITLFEKFMSEEYRQPLVEYGIYMNHPDSPQRLAAAVKTLHDRKINIERKYPLGLLRTAINQTGNKLSLTVDKTPVVTGVNNPESKAALERIKTSLDKYLQLELAPYDLHLVNGALYIGNNFTAGIIPGMTQPEEIRKNLLKAINLARAKHPTSKFFK